MIWAGALLLLLAGCTASAPGDVATQAPAPTRTAHKPPRTPSPSPSASTPTPVAPPPVAAPPEQGGGSVGGSGGSGYPWHTGITAVTFWVGEIFDPNASDGSQVYSTYDSQWMQSYGGCDGVAGGGCKTEARTAANDFFPTVMVPRENPFYLDLPFDDINNRAAFAMRDAVIPWADEEPYASHHGDRRFSYMKNRWVELVSGDRRCFGQVQDAGPAVYDDAAYVFGANDARPASRAFHNAGLDVSPALTGCLGFPETNGEATVDWRFVDDEDVPTGPWTRLVTTSSVR